MSIFSVDLHMFNQFTTSRYNKPFSSVKMNSQILRASCQNSKLLKIALHMALF